MKIHLEVRLRLAILFLAFASTIAAAAVPDEDAIARLYQRAVMGDKSAVEECISSLEAAVKAQPANQLARAYLGSAYTLRSRDMGFGPAKLTALRQGLATMDQAVAAAPEDARVRLVRARTTDALPAILGRKQSTRDDFAWLAKAAARSPDKFSRDDLATIREHVSPRGNLDTPAPSR
ncbi:MAG: hypothetical protein M3Z64_05685 [Verrucomicrobiota bacterium]|nr:hypothetical protein [Verrucomicrobiota bacterium]